MGITKRGRKSFQTISNHRAASDRELNNDTRQPAQEDNPPGTLSKQTLTTVPSHQPQHICVLELVFIGLQNYIFCISFLHTSLGQSRKRWSGYIVLKIKRRADILEI